MIFSSGACSSKISVYRSAEDVLNRFSVNVGLEGNYLRKYSFSASTSYNSMSKTVKNKDKFFSETSCSYSHLDIDLKLNPLNPELTLDPEAQSIIDGISKPFDENSWAFIKKFGTHYFKSAVIEGKYQLIYGIDRSYLEYLEKAGVNASAKGEAKGLPGMGGSGSAGVESEKQNSFQNYVSQKDKHENYFGGDADLQDQKSIEEWKESIKDAPSITSGEISPIYELIKDETKRAILNKTIEQYILKAFVENAEYQNVYKDPEITELRESLMHKTLTTEEVEELRTKLWGKY